MDKRTRMLSIAKAAEMYQLSSTYIRKLAKCRKIHAVRTGVTGNGKILINAESLEDYLASAYLPSEENATEGIKRISAEL